VALIASLSKASITHSYTFTIVSDNKRRCSNSASEGADVGQQVVSPEAGDVLPYLSVEGSKNNEGCPADHHRQSGGGHAVPATDKTLSAKQPNVVCCSFFHWLPSSND
jgi:hypothetical protein